MTQQKVDASVNYWDSHILLDELFIPRSTPCWNNAVNHGQMNHESAVSWSVHRFCLNLPVVQCTQQFSKWKSKFAGFKFNLKKSPPSAPKSPQEKNCRGRFLFPKKQKSPPMKKKYFDPCSGISFHFVQQRVQTMFMVLHAAPSHKTQDRSLHSDTICWRRMSTNRKRSRWAIN